MFQSPPTSRRLSLLYGPVSSSAQQLAEFCWTPETLRAAPMMPPKTVRGKVTHAHMANISNLSASERNDPPGKPPKWGVGGKNLRKGYTFITYYGDTTYVCIVLYSNIIS